MTLAQQGLMFSPCILKFPASYNAVNIPFGDFGEMRRGLVYRLDDDRPTTGSMLRYFQHGAACGQAALTSRIKE